MADVSVLIVNFRSTDLLRGCLYALGGSHGVRLETIVVDNGSPEFDAEAMRRVFEWVTFLPQESNTTFTAGTNLAFARSSAPLILLLNPDTAVDRDAIASACDILQSPEVVAVAAHLFNPDGTPQRYYRRLPRAADIPVVLFPGLLRNTARGRRYLMHDLVVQDRTEVEQPPGAFLLLRRKDVPEPVLDARYFNFMSDVDLCRRLTEEGAIIVSSRVRCVHVRGGAGVRTATPAEQLRLWHDLTWGIRLYFARPRVAVRLFLEAWLWAFWLARIGQFAATRPRALGAAARTAAAAIGGRPPHY